jgi:hypothetical protein
MATHPTEAPHSAHVVVTRARAGASPSDRDARVRDDTTDVDVVGGAGAGDRARGASRGDARRDAAIDDAIDVVVGIVGIGGIGVDASGVDDRARGDGARTRERDGWWWCRCWCGGESRGG